MKTLLFGLFLLAPALRAQPVPGSMAQVYTVTSDRYERFRMPRVRLPNAVVARRINRQLLRQCVDYTGSVDSTASPRQQLRQTLLECCYDQESKTWMAGGLGYTGTDYTVLLNQGYLLSVEFTRDNNGLTELAAEHLTFDLRTGKRLTLGDLVADPPAQLAQRMDWAINRRLKAELADVAAVYGDSDVIAHVAQLYGFEDWNMVKQKPILADTSAASALDEQYWLKTADFALDDHALLLYHNVGMSRIDIPFLPDPVYTFPFARIHPRGLLVPLAKAAAAKKPKTK
ncbi:hypothetical protein [Hymenobacter properus]|uniref:DUF3298 domain-containing protein n=1 Tax=Hymenobacter properus TaxID=2791026 RepID=A0A931BD23_9BACT|nr:hypothetical protein [Hymenobacter properus]MBF9140042.1 hypothetical protein [Hymenobacter properus]MBR7718849.1 hypothetical protein [Microvirga sp. SRT04]